MDLEVVTSSDRPDLDDRAAAAFRQRWPEFVFHDTRAQVHLERVSRYFASYDVLLLAGDDVVAGGWGVAMALDGIPDLPGGYDDCLARAVVDHEAGSTPTALAVMAAAVNPDFAGRGLAAEVLSALIDRARAGGLDAVFAPLRPTWKERYPLVPMAEYATWVRADGLSIDPWIRAHQRMGARILGPAPDSMVIEGTVADWEDWAAMPFPETGDYVVPGALNLVRVDREADLGCYREENLWVQHR